MTSTGTGQGEGTQQILVAEFLHPQPAGPQNPLYKVTSRLGCFIYLEDRISCSPDWPNCMAKDDPKPDPHASAS